MVERYGDFVVFKPPINWKTYLLWFAPLVFLVFCLHLFNSSNYNKRRDSNWFISWHWESKKIIKV